LFVYLFAVFVGLSFFNSKIKIRTIPITLYLVGAFFVIQIVASLLGSNVLKSFVGNRFRWDGLLTFAHIAIFVSCLQLIWQKKYNALLLSSISFGTLAASAWAVLVGIGRLAGVGETVFWEGAVGISFGNPIFLAGYILVTLPFVFRLLRGANYFKKYRYFWLLLPIVAIIFTQSYICMLGILLWVITEWTIKKLPPISMFIILGIFFAVSTAVIWQWDINKAVLISESRSRILPKLLLSAKEKPLLGFGTANVDAAFNSTVWPANVDIKLDIYLDKAHSILLEVLVTSGLLGLACYVAILITVTKGLYRKAVREIKKNDSWYSTLVIVVILYIWHSQLNVISVAEELIFWLIVGISSTFREK
jgi:hypothetical protein